MVISNKKRTIDRRDGSWQNCHCYPNSRLLCSTRWTRGCPPRVGSLSVKSETELGEGDREMVAGPGGDGGGGISDREAQTISEALTHLRDQLRECETALAVVSVRLNQIEALPSVRSFDTRRPEDDPSPVRAVSTRIEREDVEDTDCGRGPSDQGPESEADAGGLVLSSGGFLDLRPDGDTDRELDCGLVVDSSSD